MLDDAIRPYLSEGWVMDGSFDQAVRVAWEQHSVLWELHDRIVAEGATVRLRRSS
jgi:hypothetical protein